MSESKVTKKVAKKVTKEEPKAFEPVIMTESEAEKLTKKIMNTPVTTEKNPMGKVTIKLLDPKEKGRTVKCSKSAAVNWIVLGLAELEG